VVSLVLDPEVREASGGAEPVGFQHRRAAFAERHDVGGVLDRHHLVPAPDRARASRRRVAIERLLFIAGEQRASAFRTEARAASPLERLAALRALEMREEGEHQPEGIRWDTRCAELSENSTNATWKQP